MKYRIREVKTSEYTVFYSEYKNWLVSFSWRPVSGLLGSSYTMEDALKGIDRHRENIIRRKSVTVIHKVED